MTHSRKVWLAAALVSLICFILLTGFLVTMSPLEALSSPFQWLVNIHDVPEKLRMVVEQKDVDPSRLADAIRQVSAAQDLKPDGKEIGPGDVHYLETSLSDSHGNRLSVLKTGGKYYVRVLQHGSETNSALKLAMGARPIFVVLGFKELEN